MLMYCSLFGKKKSANELDIVTDLSSVLQCGGVSYIFIWWQSSRFCKCEVRDNIDYIQTLPNAMLLSSHTNPIDNIA